MSTETKSSFWETIELLISVEGRKSDKDKRDEADDWAASFMRNPDTPSKCTIGNRKPALEHILKSSMRRDSTTSEYSGRMHEDEVERFLSTLDLHQCECKFSMLPVRNKLEMLMGSNLVSLTDRDYMLYLQVRILDDYAMAINKRIALRQMDEMARVKNLVLNGKIPLREAPIEMANHPVNLIAQYCKKVLAERRAKMKVLRPFIPKYLYWDDTPPDPPKGLSIESGTHFRSKGKRMCVPPEIFLATEVSENIADGYMLEDEEYERLHYESDEVKQLRLAETVEEMYNAADEVLGIVGTYEEEEANPLMKIDSADNI